jgi:hypothetical protein
MPVIDGLALLAVLIVALFLVREVARWEKLRQERKRHTVRYYWEGEERFGTFIDVEMGRH